MNYIIQLDQIVKCKLKFVAYKLWITIEYADLITMCVLPAQHPDQGYNNLKINLTLGQLIGIINAHVVL